MTKETTYKVINFVVIAIVVFLVLFFARDTIWDALGGGPLEIANETFAIHVLLHLTVPEDRLEDFSLRLRDFSVNNTAPLVHRN